MAYPRPNVVSTKPRTLIKPSSIIIWLSPPSRFFETDEGEPAVRIRIRYTNNADMPAYMLETFDILAYQGDTPLEDISESPEAQPLFREVGSL